MERITLDQKDMRAKLLEEIAQVEQSIPALKDSAKPVAPDVSIGRLSRMEAISAQAINQRSLKSAEQRLFHLRRLVKNMDDPDFGRCMDCGGSIPEQRLLLVPESRLCVACVEEADK